MVYQLDESFKVSENIEGNVSEQIAENYRILKEADDECSKIKENFSKAIPDGGIDICKIDEVISNFKSILESIKSVAEKISSIKITAEMPKFYSFQIVIKYAEILRLKLKVIEASTKKKIAELEREILLAAAKGDGNAASITMAPIAAILTALGAASVAILTVIQAILTVISMTVMFNINGGAIAFFPTPKSAKGINIEILNSEQTIGGWMNAATQAAMNAAETSIEEAQKGVKKAKEIEMQAMGATMATTENSGEFNIPDMDLPVIDADKIKAAINAVLQICLEAEPIPRYENLSITHPRFLLFLLTGFEPAAKQSFGIPGMP